MKGKNFGTSRFTVPLDVASLARAMGARGVRAQTARQFEMRSSRHSWPTADRDRCHRRSQRDPSYAHPARPDARGVLRAETRDRSAHSRLGVAATLIRARPRHDLALY